MSLRREPDRDLHAAARFSMGGELGVVGVGDGSKDGKSGALAVAASF
jgi:hypothetical protein